MRPHSALHDAVAEGNESLKHREQQAFRASIEFSPKEAQQKTTHPSDNTGLYDEELQAPCLLSSLPLKRTDSHEKILLVFVAIAAMALIGCDDTPSSYSTFLGEWDFPENVHISVLEIASGSVDKKLDISWETDTHFYFAMAVGTAKKNVFTGTYTYNMTEKSDEGKMTSYDNPELSITVSLTLVKNKLSVVCTGDAPLDGKTFNSGV